MKERYTGTQRRMCLFVIFILIFAGMHREEISVDSSLAYPDFGAVTLQKISGGQAAVIFRDNRVESQLENVTAFCSAYRSLTGMKPGYWATLFLIPALLFLYLLFRKRLLPFCESCENQYQRRTLDYIHHKDGKKEYCHM